MKQVGLILLCLALVGAMTACAANANPTPTPTPMNTLMGTPLPGAGATDDVFPSPTATDEAALTSAMTVEESKQLSRRANDAAVKLSEIDSCVTAIIGDTCVAGVTFDPKYQGALTDRIRDMVVARIQSVAPVVERVVVTNDPEIAAQIGAMADKISKATTLGELTGEMDTVLARIP